MNVNIVQDDINNFLSQTAQQFDMSLCMMNTMGSFANPMEIIQKLLQHSKYLVFTICNEKYNAQRKIMYQDR